MNQPPQSSDKVALFAEWVFPIGSPPIRHGVVEIVGGTIQRVGPYRTGQQVRDLGPVALLPSLVNAHTHLEFSQLTAPLGTPSMTFAAWIATVIQYRRQQARLTPADRWRSDAIQHGLEISRSFGVGLLGEIATPPCLIENPSSPIHVVQFLELLGLAAERESLLRELATGYLANDSSPYVSPGLSPHAPYTASPTLLEHACELSRRHQRPLAMHLAESSEELELLRRGSGPLAELLTSLGALPAGVIPASIEPRFYLDRLALAWRSLVVHGNWLTPSDWDFLAARRATMSVAYCPRTHAYFGHPPYPLPAMLHAGVRVCVGTDSLASNPDLSVWNELRFIREKFASLSSAQILQLGTTNGAYALGCEARYGSLSPGAAASFALLPISPDLADPDEALWTTTAQPHLLTN